MRRCRVVLAFLIVLALAVGGHAYGATSPAPGSFLKQRVNSVSELVKHVSSNKLVAARYTQHFKMSKPALVAYFQDNLKLSTLRKPTVVSVYYINKANKIVKGKRLLPAGTAVFMTKAGEPVLDWRCGNPLRAQLPTPAKKVAKKPAATTAVKATAQSAATAKIDDPASTNTVVEKVLANPPVEVATLPFATAPVITAETLAPTIVTAAPAIAPPIVEAIATAPVTAIPPVIASGGGGFNFLLPAAVLGGLGAAFAGGGDGGNPPVPVPEPSGIAALATGVLGMASLYIRRPRR